MSDNLDVLAETADDGLVVVGDEDGLLQSGHFRLADRLVTQVNRVLTINKHTRLTPEAVDAAQEAPLIGH